MQSYFDPGTVSIGQELYTWRRFSLSYFRSSLIIVQVEYLQQNIINRQYKAKRCIFLIIPINTCPLMYARALMFAVVN